MATTVSNAERRSLQRLRYRKNVLHLTPEELTDLRHAFEGLYAVSATVADDGTVDDAAGNLGDERGYQWIAGVHGAPPPVYCQHGTVNFATWHRAYLYRFEKLLQDQVASVTLPWWDWAAPEAQTQGLPPAVTEESYVDVDGQTKPNPLRSAFSQWTGQMTNRSPRPPAMLAAAAASLQFAMVQTEFQDFTTNLENPHNQIHVWVGGDMGSVPTAAYDPVFWMHHANVDRYWYMWQQEHPTAVVPAAVRTFVCEPFNMTGAQVLDVYALGYSYVDQETMVPVDQVEELARTDEEAAEAEPRTSVTVPLGPVHATYRRATVELLGLRPPVESYLVHMFLNNPDATLDTERTLETGYAGIVALFGHGHCLGGPGHCDVPDRSDDPYDLRPRHHKAPADTYVDVSWPLAAIVDGEQAEDGVVDVAVTFVVEDAEGGLADPSVLDFDTVSLVTRA